MGTCYNVSFAIANQIIIIYRLLKWWRYLGRKVKSTPLPTNKKNVVHSCLFTLVYLTILQLSYAYDVRCPRVKGQKKTARQIFVRSCKNVLIISSILNLFVYYFRWCQRQFLSEFIQVLSNEDTAGKKRTTLDDCQLSVKIIDLCCTISIAVNIIKFTDSLNELS